MKANNALEIRKYCATKPPFVLLTRYLRLEVSVQIYIISFVSVFVSYFMLTDLRLTSRCNREISVTKIWIVTLKRI